MQTILLAQAVIDTSVSLTSLLMFFSVVGALAWHWGKVSNQVKGIEREQARQQEVNAQQLALINSMQNTQSEIHRNVTALAVNQEHLAGRVNALESK